MNTSLAEAQQNSALFGARNLQTGVKSHFLKSPLVMLSDYKL